MKKVGAILLPLLVVAWFAAVMYPGHIPGADYVGPYILPLIVVFVLIRAVSAAQKKQVKQARNQYSAPAPNPTGSNPGSPAPSATWAPPPAAAPPFPPAESPILPTTAPNAYPPPAPPVSTPAAPAAEAPTGVDALPAELVARLRELRTGGRTIEAVELLREHTGMELYEASRLVIGLDADA